MTIIRVVEIDALELNFNFSIVLYNKGDADTGSIWRCDPTSARLAWCHQMVLAQLQHMFCCSGDGTVVVKHAYPAYTTNDTLRGLSAFVAGAGAGATLNVDH